MGEIAFSIGWIDFYWYGLITAVAVIATAAVTVWQARLFRESIVPVIDLFIYGVPVSIVFARISFVIMDWESYRNVPAEIFHIWHGGMFFGGAVIGFILVVFLYARSLGLAFWRWADLLAPGLALGQTIGQWASLMTQEAFGFPTNLSLGIYVDFAYRPAGYEQFDFFQPVFLYESVWNAGLFLLLVICSYVRLKYNRPKSNGFLFLLYAFLYSAGHFYFESIRLDGIANGLVHSSQMISILTMAVAMVMGVGRVMEYSFGYRRR